METDKDNIRHMIETELIISVSKIVNLVKSYTTYHICKNRYLLCKQSVVFYLQISK